MTPKQPKEIVIDDSSLAELEAEIAEMEKSEINQTEATAGENGRWGATARQTPTDSH